MRTIPVDLFRVVVYLITMAATYEDAHATCTDEQVQSCRGAVMEDRLGSLSGGGQCIVKQYVQYTHLCTVSNYLPSVDSCCCAYDNSIMCCRYHQDWGNYRCSITDDTVGSIPTQSLPLEILLPVILGPVAVLVCCVICCVKCWCYRYEDDADFTCCCPDDRNKEKDFDKRLATPGGRYVPAEERMPLTCGPRYSSSPSEGSTKLMMNQCNGVGLMSPDPGMHIEPSAPPLIYDDVSWPHRTSVCISHNGCNHGNNRNSQHCSCMTSQAGGTMPPCLSNCAACKYGGSHHGGYCCQIAGMRAHEVTCMPRETPFPSCAPPMYEDITKDELVATSAVENPPAAINTTCARDAIVSVDVNRPAPESVATVNTGTSTVLPLRSTRDGIIGMSSNTESGVKGIKPTTEDRHMDCGAQFSDETVEVMAAEDMVPGSTDTNDSPCMVPVTDNSTDLVNLPVNSDAEDPTV